VSPPSIAGLPRSTSTTSPICRCAARIRRHEVGKVCHYHHRILIGHPGFPHQHTLAVQSTRMNAVPFSLSTGCVVRRVTSRFTYSRIGRCMDGRGRKGPDGAIWSGRMMGSPILGCAGRRTGSPQAQVSSAGRSGRPDSALPGAGFCGFLFRFVCSPEWLGYMTQETEQRCSEWFDASARQGGQSGHRHCCLWLRTPSSTYDARQTFSRFNLRSLRGSHSSYVLPA